MSIEIDYDRIYDLVQKYREIKQSGELRTYNEAMTKKDFILPLFEALGWNVYNKGRTNDTISAEESISKKRVDYGFRINGIPKFFIEAKALKEENIHSNAKYVTQAIDYAWMKTSSWAVLTNFETIAVYNADWKDANFRNNLFFVLHPDEFLQDNRLELISKQAFEIGSLDKEASKYGKKQIKNRIDKQLLQDMIHFREILSKNILKNNQELRLTHEDIDEAVQRILDRLIFIRSAEDRGYEENRLQSNVRQWSSRGKGELVKETSRVYSYFDEQYNSKLFATHLCDKLFIDNHVLQEVIEGLNESNDRSYRYDFSLIESDVLGNIYEQYLGSILQSSSRRAKLEKSKAHRKEQGIYYTPSFIVDYIVENTVGEFIKTHTPDEIKQVRIIDPSCGSGSFLIRAYKELESYWKKQLKLTDDDLKQTKFDSENWEQVYTLKTEILKNNIFGIDLDPKAVEIAQLNLLLQISERRHRLPLLQSNIKVGNSLVEDPNLSSGAFNWKTEFSYIMDKGGFDIVVGNPPYVRQEGLGKYKEYFSKNFEVYNGTSDLYSYFIERGISLLKENGLFSYIVANKWMRSKYGGSLRSWLKNQDILEIVDFGDLPVFKEASTYPCIIRVRKGEPNNDLLVTNVESLGFERLQDYISKQSHKVKRTMLKDGVWTLATKTSYNLLEKIGSSGIQLKEYVENRIYRGFTTGLNEAFVIDERVANEMISKDAKNSQLIKPFLLGRDIKRYESLPKTRYIVLIPNGWTKAKSKDEPDKWTWFEQNYPALANHLMKFETKAKQRWDQGQYWWELRPCDYIGAFEQPKILVPDISLRGNFTLDLTGQYYCGNTSYIIGSNEKHLLGILNSKLISWFYRNIASTYRGGYVRFIYQYLVQIPIKRLTDKEKNILSELVNDLLIMKERVSELSQKNTDELLKLRDQIIDIDSKIDAYVYELYGINQKEQSLIESDFKELQQSNIT